MGTLQWTCIVVIPGCPSLWRLINTIQYFTSPYHHVVLSDEIEEDLRIWQSFFQDYNERTFFLSNAGYYANKILVHLFTDARVEAARVKALLAK